jgi:hypothetical protein
MGPELRLASGSAFRPAIDRLLLQLRGELGATGVAAIGLIVLSALFLALVLKPLEARNAQLADQLERHSSRAGKGEGAASGAAAKLDTFYSYLGRDEAATDWLAKLYGIAKATGIDMQSATYKSQPAGKRIERYEIVLPVSGTYLQVRDFLKRALAEIPVLSLDQMSLKREARNQGEVQAELHLTLHMVKP